MSAHPERVEVEGTIAPDPTSRAAESAVPREIKIGKAAIARKVAGAEVLTEVFTMTLGSETIQLLPLKTWAQLDVFKWRARGLIPATPAGLDIKWDQLKIADRTVSPWDADGCTRLEEALNAWLVLQERSAKEKAQSPSSPNGAEDSQEEAVHFEVEAGSTGRPRLKCWEGGTLVKTVALNQQGLNALIEQGLMRKPGTLKVGALQDWVELDGDLVRFGAELNGLPALEKMLNERYTMTGDTDGPADVLVSINPASPTGFDIQFPATPNGLVENRKRHLDDDAMQLLQDPERCRVLRKGIVAKLVTPSLLFKTKTPDGGERYLEPSPDTTVSVADGSGQTREIDLSQPVSLLTLGAPELNAVFNHPAINRRARLAELAKSGGDKLQ